jgi:hypothetical protein
MLQSGVRGWKVSGILTSAALYFAVVFGVGFLLGPIGVFWLEPRLGKTVGVLCEFPVLIAAMALAARCTTSKRAQQTGRGSLAAIGGVAFIFQQLADFAVGIGLRGITPSEQLAYLTTPAGLIYCVALLLFAAMPTLVNRPLRHTP